MRPSIIDASATSNLGKTLLYYILAKTPFPKSGELWADFDLLIRLRNELVHPKPENVDETGGNTKRNSRPMKLMNQLRTRKLIDRPLGAEPDDWSFVLEDDERAAEWAEKTVKLMIQFVAKQAPASVLRESYLKPFIDPRYLTSRLWGRDERTTG